MDIHCFCFVCFIWMCFMDGEGRLTYVRPQWTQGFRGWIPDPTLNAVPPILCFKGKSLIFFRKIPFLDEIYSWEQRNYSCSSETVRNVTFLFPARSLILNNILLALSPEIYLYCEKGRLKNLAVDENMSHVNQKFWKNIQHFSPLTSKLCQPYSRQMNKKIPSTFK